ncbi:MAG: DMT family transporter [Sulfobacillus sp.]
MQWRGPLALSLAAALWGAMFVVSKILLDAIPPFVLAWLTYGIGVVILSTFALARKESWRIAWRDVPLLLVVTLSGYVISVGAQFIGTEMSTAQLGSVVTAATPSFMILFAIPILGERITAQKILAVLAASLGMVAVVGIAPLSAGQRLGGAILMITAVAWGLMSVVAKRLFRRMSPVMVTVYAMAWSLVFLAPLAAIELSAWSYRVLSQPPLALGILYMGVMATATAYLLWNYGMARMEAGSGGVFLAIQPLVGSLLGWLILHEPIGLGTMLGFLLIASGIALTARQIA